MLTEEQFLAEYIKHFPKSSDGEKFENVDVIDYHYSKELYGITPFLIINAWTIHESGLSKRSFHISPVSLMTFIYNSLNKTNL